MKRKVFVTLVVCFLLAACGQRTPSPAEYAATSSVVLTKVQETTTVVAQMPTIEPDLDPLIVLGEFGLDLNKDWGGYSECPMDILTYQKRAIKFDDHTVHLTRTTEGVKWNIDGNTETETEQNMMDMFKFVGTTRTTEQIITTYVLVCFTYPDEFGLIRYINYHSLVE